MIKTVNVLDLKRGDTVVIVEGRGKHRGGSADMGCIDITGDVAYCGSATGRRTDGAHSRPRVREPYVVFYGHGDGGLQGFVATSDTDLVVLR